MREDSLYYFLIQETFFRLVEHLCDLTRTYGATTLTDSETQTNVQSNSINQLNSNLHVITRHYHLNALGQMNLTCAVHCAEVELRTVLVAEWCVTTTLFLLQHVDRCLEALVRSDNSGVSDNHTTLNVLLVDTTEQQTYVVTSFALVKNLAEHLNTSNN